jgi:hypothetical protein
MAREFNSYFLKINKIEIKNFVCVIKMVKKNIFSVYLSHYFEGAENRYRSKNVCPCHFSYYSKTGKWRQTFFSGERRVTLTGTYSLAVS